MNAVKLAEYQRIRTAIRYEAMGGCHTYHTCDCGKKPCRGKKCIECLLKELDEVVGNE
jgi:hypothetical protein